MKIIKEGNTTKHILETEEEIKAFKRFWSKVLEAQANMRAKFQK